MKRNYLWLVLLLAGVLLLSFAVINDWGYNTSLAVSALFMLSGMFMYIFAAKKQKNTGL